MCSKASILDLQRLVGWQSKTKPYLMRSNSIVISSFAPDRREFVSDKTQFPKTERLTSVCFKTLEGCKLGISRFPDFEYDARGGTGTGTATATVKTGDEVSVDFDLQTLYIPPLTSATTRFLGLPLPPFLRIDIAPELFLGTINRETGQVELEFTAKFLFSVGDIYRAPPLVVKTTLTSEESIGRIRRGRGERMSKEKCTLVGVAVVDPTDDFFMNSFLTLPTECLARLHAVISFSHSP